jgi:hypothetical protein
MMNSYVIGKDETSRCKPTVASILRRSFIALFLQLQLVLLASLISQKPIYLVHKLGTQIDFIDFLRATADWQHGINPYLRSRFVTPPPSLLVGLPFQHFSFGFAANVFFMANIAVITASLWGIYRHFKLTKEEGWLLFGIASIYFPVIFLVERGNLDGIMLGLILLFVFARNSIAKTVGLSLSITIKVYSLLLVTTLIWARRWKQVSMVLALALLISLPFHGLIWQFMHLQSVRSTQISALENLSPADLLGGNALRLPVKLLYGLLWLISYSCMLHRHRESPLSVQLIYSFPWMMAMPLQVFPYTGVLMLPVLVLKSQEITANGLLTYRDRIFLIGFFLVGFQQTAMTEYFQWLTHSHRLFGWFNSLGTTLVIFALASTRSNPNGQTLFQRGQTGLLISKQESPQPSQPSPASQVRGETSIAVGSFS